MPQTFRLLALLIALLCAQSSASAEPRFIVDVAADDTLNVRVDPNWQSLKVGELNPGTEVYALREAPNGWVLIQYGELKGWVNGSFLYQSDSSEVSRDTVSPSRDISPTSADDLRLRETTGNAEADDYGLVAVDTGAVHDDLSGSAEVEFDSERGANSASFEVEYHSSQTSPVDGLSIDEASEANAEDSPLSLAEIVMAIIGGLIILSLMGIRAAVDEVDSELRKPNLVGRYIWHQWKNGSRK